MAELDPNIAALREALSVASGELTIQAVTRALQAVTRARAALDALASALAERDRRIALLERALGSIRIPEAGDG